MYKRVLVDQVKERLKEKRHFLQIISGPRQTGKTTAIMQACRACYFKYYSTCETSP